MRNILLHVYCSRLFAEIGPGEHERSGMVGTPADEVMESE